MAIIHNARNDLEIKLDRLVNNPNPVSAPQPEKTGAAKTRGIVLWAIPVALCVFAFLYMLRHPEAGENAERWVSDFLYNLAFDLPSSVPRESQLLGLMEDGFFKILLTLVLELLLAAAGAVLFLLIMALRLVLPLAVRAGMYLLPLLVGGFSGLLLAGHVLGWELDTPTNSREADILRAGLEGERQALSLLSTLGNDCHIFTNLRIPYDGKESETDLIVVSPAGVTVVEVKNHKGTISGDAADEELTQQKRHDGTDEKSFYNPIRQVGTHTYRLAGYLRSHGVSTHVRSCVLFVSEDVRLELTDRTGITREKCPVFSRGSVSRLLGYVGGICSYRREASGRTVQLLEELVQESFAA